MFAQPLKLWARPKTKMLTSIFILAALASACGDKENKVGPKTGTNTGTNNSGWTNNGPHNGTQYVNPTQLTGEQVSTFQQIKSSLNCQMGTRLVQDITFATQGAGNQSSNRTNITGPFQSGSVPGGSAQKIYVGVSQFNDIMMVSKVVNGSQVVGYNITLSMCPYVGQDQTPYYHDSRPISAFHAPRGIILDEDNHCGIGSVDAAIDTRIVAAAHSYTQQSGFTITLPEFAPPTTFYKPACNGNY